MSSTNRSRAREAHVSDYYVTPVLMIRDFLKAWHEDCIPCRDIVQILDPCAGGHGKQSSENCALMSYPAAIQNYSGWDAPRITTVDCREDSLADIKADYLTWQAPAKYDLVITNPPFNIAMEVIQKALFDTASYGMVVMLLRLNFFGSKERQGFFQKNMPLFTYVHTKRPKFLNTGGTDSIEYCHAVWQKDNPCRFTKMRII